MGEYPQREAENPLDGEVTLNVNINLLNDNMLRIYIFHFQFLSNEMEKK